MPLLEVRGLTVSYSTDRGTVRALRDVDLDLDAGEVVGMVGESGSGKTTLVLAALRLVPSPGRVDAGSLSLDGRDLRELSPVAMRRLRGKELAFVPQAAMSSLNPVMTVGSQIGESLTLHTDLTGAAARRRVAEVLEMVELERATVDRYPHQLSGGMRQRAVIAMALAPRPRVILADEPTSGLDVLVRVQVLRLLRDLAGQLGVALLLVSHDLPMVSRWCDRAVVMYAGRVVEEGPAAELLTAPLHPYAEALGRSLPRLRGEAAPRPIPGEVPDLTKLPAGCPFRGRCTREMAACGDRMPDLITIGGHRVACHLHEGDGVRLEPDGSRHGV